MKPVLLVTYYYPPSSAVGAVRPSKFADHLPAFGWHPTILTASAPSREAHGNVRERRDERGDSGNGGMRPIVSYAAEWPHPLKAYERLRERAAAKLGRAQEHAAKIVVPYTQCYAPARGGLKRWLLALLWLPDRETAWLVPAVLRGLREIRRSGIQHVITTGPPFTCHLVGLILKQLAGVRWIADFRDPWSVRHKFPIFRNGVTDRVETRLIALVMRRADLILSVTPAMTEEAKKEHTDIPTERFQTLISGFDPADFTGLHWSRPYPDPVVFSYFGTFYHGRTPEPFLGALKSLLDDGSLKPQDVRVRFVGQVSLADGQPVQEMVRLLGLDGLVSLHTSVPRREALKQTLESHVVLVLDERHPIQIPLKLYDAIAAGVTVFNVGSGGAAADVLRQTGRGLAVSYERPAEIRAGILECVKRARAGMMTFSATPWEDPAIQGFDFHRLAGRLAAYLNTV
jgi:glycosyltransferase involved in cell wall biosynthesis